MVIRSYVRSTDDHCESRSKYIFPSVDISINAFGVATRTIPSADIERELIHHEPTMVTPLTARKKAVNLDQFSPIPFTLILKLTKHLSPSSVRDRPSQLVIFDHVSHGKIFNGDYAIVSNQISSQFVEEIGTGIFNFGVYFSYFKSRALSVTRAFGFPTRNARSGKHLNSIQVNLTAQFLLRYFQLLIQPIEMLWIGYFLSVTGSQQTRNTNVNPNLIFSWWQWLNSWIVYQQRNKPSTRWFKFDRDSRRTTAVAHMPRPNYVQWFLTLGKPQLTISVFKSRLGKFSRTTIAFGFKPWILGTFPPEISKRFVQMSQALLQRNAANFVEKSQVFSLFPTSQQARGLFVINPLLLFIPSFGFSRQGFVVDQAHTTHCSSQEIFLLDSG
jgi:hypothetical protein